MKTKKQGKGILSQDAFALLGGMVTLSGRVVKGSGGRKKSEYKGNTILGIDRHTDR